MSSSTLALQAHALIAQYMLALNRMDRGLLQSRFGVGESILGEIGETLEEYFGHRPDIDLAPPETAFSGRRGSQPFIDLYEMNEPGFWGAGCAIWVHGQPQEPTLHVELSKVDGELQLRHKYIGS